MMHSRFCLAALLVVGFAAGCDDDTTVAGTDDLATAPADMTEGGDLAPGADMAQAAGTPTKKVIVFVWDGLRPDSVSQADTPNLYALKMAGVDFQDNHSTYPTFTMMNSAAFATGSFPQTTGFYGNTLYAPGATGANSGGGAQDFVDPVFTEDYAVLQDLDTYYGNKLHARQHALPGRAGARADHGCRRQVGRGLLAGLSQGRLPRRGEHGVAALAGQGDPEPGDVLPSNTPIAYAPGQVTLELGQRHADALAGAHSRSPTR